MQRIISISLLLALTLSLTQCAWWEGRKDMWAAKQAALAQPQAAPATAIAKTTVTKKTVTHTRHHQAQKAHDVQPAKSS